MAFFCLTISHNGIDWRGHTETERLVLGVRKPNQKRFSQETGQFSVHKIIKRIYETSPVSVSSLCLKIETELSRSAFAIV